MKRIKSNAQKGFTLVEMIVVLIILGVLAAVTVPSLVGYITKMHASACELTRQNLKTAYESVIATERNSGIEPKAETFQWEVMDALRLCDHADLVPDDVHQQASMTMLKITGLCGDNVVTAMRWRDGTLHLSCEKHGGDELDPSGAITQQSEFEAALNTWIENHPDDNLTKTKGEFYAEYYATRGANKVPEELRAALTEFGMYGTGKNTGNSSLVGLDMYWWTYPQTDANGNLLYTVTYLNNSNDPNKWQQNNTAIKNAYAVEIDGVIYVRKTGATARQPGNNNPNKYKDKQAWIDDLLAGGYEIMPFP